MVLACSLALLATFVPPRLTVAVPADDRLTLGDSPGLRAVGLAPGERIRVHGLRKFEKIVNQGDGWGPVPVILHSWADATANARGEVDFDRLSVRQGSWRGKDPLGFFWSGVPEGHPRSLKPWPEGLMDGVVFDGANLVLRLERQGRLDEPLAVPARAGRKGIRIEVIDQGRFRGVLGLPGGDQNAPCVIILHGSEGADLDSARAAAARFAARGYAALFLSYSARPWIDYPGVRKDAVNIPLEILEDCRRWLRARDDVDGSRIGLVGWSKGGEFALSAAARMSWIKSVVALVPADAVWEGYGRRIEPGEVASSWTWRGKPLDYIPYVAEFGPFQKANPGAIATDWHRASLRAVGPQELKRAQIPIDAATASILILAGGRDEVWPSGEMSRDLAGPGRRVVVYPEAGHGIVGDGTFPVHLYGEPPKKAGDLDPQANGPATAAAFRETILHLRKTL